MIKSCWNDYPDIKRIAEQHLAKNNERETKEIELYWEKNDIEIVIQDFLLQLKSREPKPFRNKFCDGKEFRRLFINKLARKIHKFYFNSALENFGDWLIPKFWAITEKQKALKMFKEKYDMVEKP